jgi:hypothetical protein
MATEDRDRGRYLREMAELAKPGCAAAPPASPSSRPPPPPPSTSARALEGLESTDSSGYVDLQALMAADANWADRELERATGPRSAAPASIAPIALPALAPRGAEPVQVDPRTRAAKWLFGGAVVACVTVIGLAAAKRASDAAKPAVAPPHVMQAAAPPQTQAPAQTQAPVPAQMPAQTQDTPATKANAAQPAHAPSGPARRTVAAPVVPHHSAPAAAPVATPAAAPAATPPAQPAAAAPTPGSDPVMDAIRRSIHKSK